MNKLVLLLTLSFVGLNAFSAEKTLGEFKFNKQQKENKYYKSFVKWAKEDISRTPDEGAVLCVGSSSMRLWRTIKQDLAPLKVIHRGFGGSTMRQVLIWKDFFLRYNAGTVLIYEGDNDLVRYKSKPEEFLKMCKNFCDLLLKQNPKVKIYFISIKPSVSRVKAWARMTTANKLLVEYAASNPQINYIDASTEMLNKNGTPRADILRKDNLHMNKKGYDIWKKHVRKALIK